MAPTESLSGAAFRDPSNTGFRRTHDIQKGGTFSVYADIEISAPVHAVCEVLTDVLKWHEWNHMVTKVEIKSHPHPHTKDLRMIPGTFMIFHVQLVAGEEVKFREACSHVGRIRTLEEHEPPALTHIRWDLHNAVAMAPSFIIKAQRENELEDVGQGRTVYRTWQTFSGLAAKSYQKKYEQALKEKYQEWCVDLKKRVESLHHHSTDIAPAINVEDTEP